MTTMPKTSRLQKTTAKMNPTRHDLPEATRSKVAELLNQSLADSIDLQLQVKEAHWNIKGPTFIGVHKFLDEVEEELEEYSDMIAERVVQLGGRAEGTVQRVNARSKIPNYPLELHAVLDHLTQLADNFAVYAKSLRKGIDQADQWGDADTADLYTEASRWTDKTLWFIEAHLL